MSRVGPEYQSATLLHSHMHGFMGFKQFAILEKLIASCCPCRGNTAMNGAGLGIDRPAELSKNDDEYDAYRKRMMLAYRFRPNPLVTSLTLKYL